MNNTQETTSAKPEDIPESSLARPGIHLSYYRFAYLCALYGIDYADCEDIIEIEAGSSWPQLAIPRHKLKSDIAFAYQRVGGDDNFVPPEPAPSESDQSDRGPLMPRQDNPLRFEWIRLESENHFVKRELTIEQLHSVSPLPPPQDVKSVLQMIFAPEEIVCLSRGGDLPCAGLMPRSVLDSYEESQLRSCPLIVPHPMLGIPDPTTRGKISPRSNHNTGPRRWWVLEFDEPPEEWQASLVAVINDEWSPTIVVHAKDLGLQAWYCTAEKTKDVVGSFEAFAAHLGANPGLLGDKNRSEWVWMPNAMNSSGRKQELVFWNPGHGKICF